MHLHCVRQTVAREDRAINPPAVSFFCFEVSSHATTPAVARGRESFRSLLPLHKEQNRLETFGQHGLTLSGMCHPAKVRRHRRGLHIL